MIFRALILWVSMCAMAHAQGFAGLGAPADGFVRPVRGAELRFPEDHGAHPPFRIEWWYLTANLRDERGRDYGVQWTLFRTALSPEEGGGWSSPQLFMGHAAVTSGSWHVFEERRARGGVGQAGVNSEPFTAWIDNWVMRATDDTSPTTLSPLTVSARGNGFGFNLDLVSRRALVLHGDRGFSVKSPDGQASFYYSQPFYEARGRIRRGDTEIEVEGVAWLDREWSSQPLAAEQSGWDWVSLHLSDGAKLMGFRVRDSTAGFTSATYISPDGKVLAVPHGELTLEPSRAPARIRRGPPLAWRVRLPRAGIDVTINAINPDAFIDGSVPYWEGPVRITGSHSGRGYLEMTGY